MKKKKVIFSSFLLLCSSGVTASPWDDNETEVVLAPGGTQEECFLVETPIVLKYRFLASDNVVFNIHYHHHHTGMEYPVPATTMSQLGESQIALSVPSAHCLMWENTSMGGNISINYSFILEKVGSEI